MNRTLAFSRPAFAAKAAIVAVLGLLVVPAAPALGATPPETRTITGTYENEVIAECDGFDVVRNGEFTVVRRTFFGSEGEPVRLQIHVTRRAVVQNSVTGKTARDDAVWTLMFDLAGDTLAGSGKFENITVPGYGSVRYDIGHFVESPDGSSSAGRVAESDGALCTSLATG